MPQGSERVAPTRRIESAFIARGLRSRDAARRSGDYVAAEVMLADLQRKLDAARRRSTQKHP